MPDEEELIGIVNVEIPDADGGSLGDSAHLKSPSPASLSLPGDSMRYRLVPRSMRGGARRDESRIDASDNFRP